MFWILRPLIIIQYDPEKNISKITTLEICPWFGVQLNLISSETEEVDVVKDVSDNAVVVGIPGKVLKNVKRNNFS